MSPQELAGALRFLANGWVGTRDPDSLDWDENARYLLAAADELEHTAPGDWICCPMCQEVLCDEGCPVLPMRVEENRTRL
jgi:hypothetical protein